MKRFKFRLARVQRAREIAERQARADWQLAESEAIAAEVASDELRASIEAARKELAGLQSFDNFSPGAVLAADRALERSFESLVAKRRIACEQRVVAEQFRQTWSDRERDRLALERLEERQVKKHRIEVTRAEDAEMDEWAAARRHLRTNPS